MTNAVQAGQLGVDWSGASLTGAQVKAAGGHFVLRYSAGAGNSSHSVAWKLCKVGEIASITADGCDFIANSEWSTNRIEDGAGAGHDDGVADLAFWKSRGLAKGATVYVSWDTYPNPAKYNAVEAYLRAYKAAMGGYYCPNGAGMYGGSAAIREMKKRGVLAFGWQSESGSFSDNGLHYQPSDTERASVIAHPPAGIDLWQTGNYWFNNSADEDVCLRTPCGSHLEALTPPKPPTPAKDWFAMATRADLDDAIDDACKPGGSIYELVEDRIRPNFNRSTHETPVAIHTLLADSKSGRIPPAAPAKKAESE